MNTREAIVEKALELFNEKGIEYTGMRELAGLLHIRVSNITYYFPTKDELVLEIANNLRLLNTQAFEGAGLHGISGFLAMYRQIFFNQYRYRCLFLSFVHLVTQNHIMAKDYHTVEGKRKKQITNHIHRLIENGHLQKKLQPEQIQLIIGGISLVSRFWISEVRISYPKLKLDDVIDHYLKILAAVFYPYATLKGKSQLKGIKGRLIEG